MKLENDWQDRDLWEKIKRGEKFFNPKEV